MRQGSNGVFAALRRAGESVHRPHLRHKISLLLIPSLPQARQKTPHFLLGREPLIKISTRRRALACQSGPKTTLETPTRARTKSNGSRSSRISPLAMARFTSNSIAPPTRAREPAYSFDGPPIRLFNLLGGDVIDEKQHPCTQSLRRRQFRRKLGAAAASFSTSWR
jgi:hypothetical protein